ncbi:MAG: cell envelope integrity protein TolA [Halieaceae bacterium]|nr:cell envelope integrity protein TolA [Halieaceae bacterium]
MKNRPGFFWRPALLTLALHGLLVAALLTNWSMAEDTLVSTPPVPRYIEARLVEVAPAPKKKPVSQKPTQPAAKAQPAPQPKPQPKPKPKPKPEPAPQSAPEPEPDENAKPEPEPAQEPRSVLDDIALAIAQEDRALEAVSDAQRTASYTALIARAVQDNWSRPPSARNGMEAELLIQLIPSGKVVNVSLVRSSGSPAFDSSAVSAVERAAAFPELQNMEPGLFEKNFRRLRLKFKPEDLRY